MISSLRADRAIWDESRRLSTSIYAETLAINQAPQTRELAMRAARSA